MHLLAVGRCAVSKIRKKAKKREDEMQYIKEEKGIPMMGKDGIISKNNSFKRSLEKWTRVLQKEWPNKYSEWMDCQIHLTLF